MPPRDRLSRELVQLALDYHRLRPWTRITAEAPFLVRASTEDEPLGCFVLGRSGENVGLGILRGPGVPRALEVLLVGEEMEEVARHAAVLNVGFEPRHLLGPADLRVLEAAGHSARREAAVPVFGCFDTREGFRSPRRPEMRAMAAALRATLAADRAGKLVPRPWDPRRRRALEIELEGRGKKEHLLDRVVVVPGGEVTWTPASDPFPGRWEGAYDDLPRLDAEWIVGRAPAPIADDDVGHDFLAVLEARSGTALAGSVLPADDGTAAREYLGRILRGESAPGSASGEHAWPPGLPRAVVFTSRGLLDALGAAFEDLGVEVGVEVDHPVYRNFMESFGEFVARDLGEEPGARDPEPDDHAAWRALDDDLSRRLVGPRGLEELQRGHALARWFGSREAGEEALADPPPDLWPMLLDWWVTDYRATHRSKTRVERLLARRDLSEAQRALLEARRDAAVSLYRVTRVEPDAHVEVEDVFGGGKRLVHDRAFSRNAPEGILLFLRLYRAGDWTFCALLGRPIDPLRLDSVLHELERLGLELDEGGVRAGHHLLGRIGEILEASKRRAVLQNTDGETLVPLVARFRAADPERAARALEDLPGLQRDGETEWTWLEERPGSPGLENGVVLARFELLGDELVARTNSAQRLLRVRELLDGVGDLVFETAREEEPRERPPTSSEPPPPDDPELRAAIEEQVRASCMSWLDTPVPTLEGRTPRAAHRDPAWRKRVERMVRTYPDSPGPWGIVAAPREEMLRVLRGE